MGEEVLQALFGGDQVEPAAAPEGELDLTWRSATSRPWAGAVYVEPPDSERFVRVYDRLLDSALGSAESAELIRVIGEDLE